MGETLRVIRVGVQADIANFQRDMEKGGRILRGFSDSGKTLSQDLSQVASKGLTALAKGMNVAAAASEAANRQWLGLGASILTNFAVGGPIMGGITALAGAIGFFTSQTGEAEQAARKLREEEEKHAKVLDVEIAKLKERNRELDRRISLEKSLGRAPTGTEEAIAKQREVVRKLEAEATAVAAASAMESMFPDRDSDAPRLSALQTNLARERAILAELEGQLGKERELERLEQDRAGWAEATARWQKEITRDLQAQTAASSAVRGAGAFSMSEAEIERQEGLLELIKDMDQSGFGKGDIFPGGGVAAELGGTSIDPGEVTRVVAETHFTPLGGTLNQWDQFTQSLGPQVVDFWADSFLAGITRGADGLQDVAQNFLMSIGSSLIKIGLSGVAAGLGIPMFGEGGYVEGPTMALIGEKGPEYVVPEQTLERLAEMGDRSSFAVTVNVAGASRPEETGRAVTEAIRREIRGPSLRRILRGGRR